MDRKALMKDFLAAMYKYAPAQSMVMTCTFRGDPNADIAGKWRARPIVDVDNLDDGANVYLSVSAMGRNERGEYRRRKENFAAGLLLMIDDIGTGPGSKFPMSILDAATPTALIETSPENFQAVYMFNEAVTDATMFNALINGFIARQFLGKDTGMAGINRVFRPPYGVNGKPKYGGWSVRAAAWHPETRYSLGGLAEEFGIDIQQFMPVTRKPMATRSISEGMKAFVQVRRALRDMGMLKAEEPDLAGWQNIICPWTADHTGGADNGAAIREPAEENGWTGAFRCHHGSCKGRGWRELTEVLADDAERAMAAINAAAPEHFVAGDWL